MLLNDVLQVMILIQHTTWHCLKLKLSLICEKVNIFSVLGTVLVRHCVDFELEVLHSIAVAVLEDQRQVLSVLLFPVFTTKSKIFARYYLSVLKLNIKYIFWKT